MFFYIDPGTGSMLFSILIGVVSTALFFGQRLFMKLKFILSGGKTEKISSAKIPYVIFSDHKRYWNVFKPICDEFEKRGINAVYWTASNDDPALKEKYEHVKTEFIGEGNKAFARLNMMNAGVCLSTTPGLDVYQWKRSRNCQKYVHILHMVNDPTTYRMFGLDFYDSVLLSGDFQVQQIRKLEELRNITKKDLQVVGCTYMDSMKKKFEQYKASVAAASDSERPFTVLVAPSWGESGILSRYGETLIQSLIETGFQIVIRPHPQSFTAEKELIEKLQKKFPDGNQLHWNSDNDNFAALYNSDVMISDFSGVIFDYSLVFNKPVLYADTSFDYAPYDAAWLDEPLWTFSVLPEIGMPLEKENFSNLKEILLNITKSEEFKKKREEVRKQCWANCDNAAVKVVDYLVGIN